MKNDNKGRDIFYGVVAVATLIVAIIGATLAYFSISASSNEGAVNATSATVSIEYSDGKQVTAQATQLIPATLDVVKSVYEKNVKDLEPSEEILGNACIDDKNKQVCSTYRFSVKSDVERQIRATINNEYNGFSFLSYAVYDVTGKTWLALSEDGLVQDESFNKCSNEDEDNSIEDCFTPNEDGKTKTYTTTASKSIFGYTNGKEIKPLTIEAGVAHEYELVLFIKENRGNQNIDQGQNYRGTIVVEVIEDGSTNGQITGCVGEDC